MFIQVINGTVEDAAAARELGDRWVAEVKTEHSGWLGTTAGVSADNELVVLAGFESAEAARRNSERPEQGAWWAEMEKLFVTEPTFGDYEEVIVVRGGESPGAGFVQVMFGRTNDVERERALLREFTAADSSFRPELLGGLIALQDDGRFTQAFYFSSESEARAAERLEPPEELRKLLGEEVRLTTEIRYVDLTEPWLYSG